MGEKTEVKKIIELTSKNDKEINKIHKIIKLEWNIGYLQTSKENTTTGINLTT